MHKMFDGSGTKNTVVEVNIATKPKKSQHGPRWTTEEVNLVEINEKLKILKSLDTKDLTAKIHQYEAEFEKALIEQADFKAQNHGYLGSGDCQEAKRILAELAAQTPETNEAGKKMTVADKEAWLQKQRVEHKELSEAIQKQRMATFLIDNHEIKVEMARRRLTGVIAVLALKTAQIYFLAGGS